MAINSKSSQKFIPIDDIHDGVVILKDGSMRMILMASSVNFALKSEDEQIGIIMQFQNFLNSLEFSTQIYIQSRRLDIKPYIALLQSRLNSEVSDLMRIQIEEYIEFVRNFTDNSNIMAKSFFVIVPYHPRVAVTFGKGEKEQGMLERFEEGKTQLEQRAHIVRQGLVRCGVRVVPLGTEEIVELFYKIFNPSDIGRSVNLAQK